MLANQDLLLQKKPADGEDRRPDYLSFLRHAAEEISSSIEYKDTLQSVANIMVPQLSDWCGVDILGEDGVLRRLAIAHKDPSKIKLARQLTRQYPPDPQAPSGSFKVIRTGEPEMLNGITDKMLATAAIDNEHLELMRALDFHSLLIYPIRSRGQILGTISFVWTEHKHNYTLTDVAFVEILSVMAGNAIDNARLIAALKRQSS